MGIVSTEEFQPRTADKVERLLDILEEVEQHPDLRGKLAMHGGTAINLFMLGMPRLSVDIDVSYVGAVDRETMLLERPLVETAIGEVATALGYAVSSGEGGHAGRTFILRYGGAWGSDHVKIDCIYMNRSPIVTPTLRSCPLRPDARVLMFCDAELAAGKVKAFFDRVKGVTSTTSRTWEGTPMDWVPSRRGSSTRPSSSMPRCPRGFRFRSRVAPSVSGAGEPSWGISCCPCSVCAIRSPRSRGSWRMPRSS